MPNWIGINHPTRVSELLEPRELFKSLDLVDASAENGTKRAIHPAENSTRIAHVSLCVFGVMHCHDRCFGHGSHARMRSVLHDVQRQHEAEANQQMGESKDPMFARHGVELVRGQRQIKSRLGVSPIGIEKAVATQRMTGSGPSEIFSCTTQSLPILQDQPRDHPPCGDDARVVPTFASKRGGPFARKGQRQLPRDGMVLVAQVRARCSRRVGDRIASLSRVNQP